MIERIPQVQVVKTRKRKKQGAGDGTNIRLDSITDDDVIKRQVIRIECSK